MQQDPAPEVNADPEEKTLTSEPSKTEKTPPTSKTEPDTTEAKRPKVRNPVGAELRKATKGIADAVDKVFKPSTTAKPDSTDSKHDNAGTTGGTSACENASNDDASKAAA